MDEQNQQPAATDQVVKPQLVVSLAQSATAIHPNDKPKLNITDKEAQALLAINNVQLMQAPRTKPPVKLLLAVIGLLVAVVVFSLVLGAFKPKTSSQSSSPVGGLGIPNQSNPTSGNGVSNQINQDVKACSNPLNAVTTC